MVTDKSTREAKERELDLERTGWQAATRSEAGPAVQWWLHISWGKVAPAHLFLSLIFSEGAEADIDPCLLYPCRSNRPMKTESIW